VGDNRAVSTGERRLTGLLIEVPRGLPIAAKGYALLVVERCVPVAGEEALIPWPLSAARSTASLV